MQRLKDSPEVRARYEQLVATTATASVYHTLEWLRVFEAMSYDIEFVDTGETIIPFVCKGVGVFRRGFSLPYDTYGGAIAGSGLVSYDEVIQTLRVPSARIVDYAAKTNGTSCGVEMVTTHIVPLDDDYERVAEAYAVMNRRAIRQAAKRGVAVRQVEDASEIPIFHAFYLDSAHRYGSPPLPLKFFQAIYEIMVPKGLARFYLAWNDGQAVGGNLILRHRDKAYDWTWGYNRELQHLRPTNAMIDQAIRDEIELGSTEFNLGASPVNANGNAQFKENFGALPFSYNIISKTNFYYDAARRIKYGRGWLTNRNGHSESSD